MEDPFAHIVDRARMVAAFVNAPEAHERVENVKSPINRMVLRAVLATPGLPLFLYRKLISHAYEEAGFRVIGTGTHAVTVLDGDSGVKKFYPESRGMNETKMRALLKRWNDRQDPLLEHLEPFTIPQAFTIESDPLNPNGGPIVASTQELILARKSISFTDPRWVSPDGQLADFIQRSHTMYHTTPEHAVPDIIGSRNVLIGMDGQPLLVDTVSLFADDHEDAHAHGKSKRILNIEDK